MAVQTAFSACRLAQNRLCTRSQLLDFELRVLFSQLERRYEASIARLVRRGEREWARVNQS